MGPQVTPLSRPLIEWTERGLYCSPGDFYIDPHRAVDTAIVTHAHSDHARRGSRRYICANSSVGLLKSRLGKNILVESVEFRESFILGDTRVSLHPAGHILGSAQVRVEHRGEVWVASGDYKRDPDPSCEPFEPVACDTFITEATFGTPKYVWNRSAEHGRSIHEWWMKNAAEGWNSVLFGYSLGKAQRILAELHGRATRPIVIHPTITELTECYRREGRALAETAEFDPKAQEILSGDLILAPPSVLESADWMRRLGQHRTAFASGWMQGGSSWGRSRAYDHGFVMSDHADWDGLNQTIRESGARRVFVQHRASGALVRHLRNLGLEAHPAEDLALDRYAKLGGVTPSLFS